MYVNMLNRAFNIVNNFLAQKYSHSELLVLRSELNRIYYSEYKSDEYYDNFFEIQDLLSTLNERESIRKTKGVYYTPNDVVSFIVTNSFKILSQNVDYFKLDNSINFEVNFMEICFSKTVFDPTCGAGEFLIETLDYKYNLLERSIANPSIAEVHAVLQTIFGNDINPDSINITKLRIFLYILERYGIDSIIGISKILSQNFTVQDYLQQLTVSKESLCERRFDVILGNPPYVEQSKSGLELERNYGNIYAHVLEKSSTQLKQNGVIGFIIPLSYVSTPRMKSIRETLYKLIPTQVILNFSDRPDCLFTSVHQKLTIIFGRNTNSTVSIFTGNYTYWYKNERDFLFQSSEVIENNFIEEKFIPKLGNNFDVSIYKNIKSQANALNSLFDGGDKSIYLNMRAAFWIKAFLNKHKGSEYKIFSSSNVDNINYAMCLFNSSLFWWFWICISDCWHITQKELNGFRIPINFDTKIVKELANNLEMKLEETKLYVGTKQTEFEYKHRLCVEEIHKIDDYINQLFGLSEAESDYIKSFAYKYRISGGRNVKNN